MTIKQLLKVFIFTNEITKIDVDVVNEYGRGVHTFTSSAIHELLKNNAPILNYKIRAVSVSGDHLYIVVRG